MTLLVSQTPSSGSSLEDVVVSGCNQLSNGLMYREMMEDCCNYLRWSTTISQCLSEWAKNEEFDNEAEHSRRKYVLGRLLRKITELCYILLRKLRSMVHKSCMQSEHQLTHA